MEVKANLNNLKISPRKVRLVIDVVRGMEVNKALNQLQFINKEARKPVVKLISSAIANSVHNFDLDKNNLFIKKATVDGGAVLKRWMPKAHGRATPIRKRTSHITLVLAEIVESGKKTPKKKAVEAPIKLGDISKSGTLPKEDEGIKIKKKKEDQKIPAAGKLPEDKGKKIVDPRGEGKGKHVKIEGASEKGFIGKVFRRKSG
ncbi:MAG: 50S ribosomal protein L22 [Patescibacteria group bacterium]|jgi:large subunit ribosomal protein L22